MTSGMRWRIMSLQAILVLVLAGAAAFLYSESNFVNGFIRDQLVAQNITFPGTDQIKAGGALDPAEFPASIRQYAGTHLDNGDKAKEYANNFIGKHLESVGKDPVTGSVVKDANGNFLTYATMGDYINQQKAAGASAATLATLNGERDTMFKGEMLRGTLLNAWGWSQVAYYTLWAALGLAIAALLTLAALVYEVFAWRREVSRITLKAPKSAAQPA